MLLILKGVSLTLIFFVVLFGVIDPVELAEFLAPEKEEKRPNEEGLNELLLLKPLKVRLTLFMLLLHPLLLGEDTDDDMEDTEDEQEKDGEGVVIDGLLVLLFLLHLLGRGVGVEDVPSEETPSSESINIS
jgi:hypothetical protein